MTTKSVEVEGRKYRMVVTVICLIFYLFPVRTMYYVNTQTPVNPHILFNNFELNNKILLGPDSLPSPGNILCEMRD